MREGLIVLEDNYIFFKNNLPNFLKQYEGKYIVIKDKCVVGSYDALDEAYRETIKKEALGTFIIQQCVPITPIRVARFA